MDDKLFGVMCGAMTQTCGISCRLGHEFVSEI